MAKRDKLYTANRYNQAAFMPEENLYWIGGEVRKHYGYSKDDWKSLDAATRQNLKNSYFDTDDYLNHKNIFGLTRENNPFSRENIGSTAGTIGTGLSAVAGNLAGGLIADGYSVGSGLGAITSGIQAFNTGNPVIDIVKNVGAGILGGVVNRGWGTKRNEGNIKALEANRQAAKQAAGQLAGTTSSNDFFKAAGQMTTGTGFGTTDLVKGGWWSKGKARRQGQEMLNKENADLAFQNHAMMTGAENVDDIIDDNIMSNFAAYGGPLDMIGGADLGPAITYGFVDDYLNNGRRKFDNQGSSDNLATILASGGKIHIKPSHRGKLTELKKRTGKSEAELYNDGNPAHKKMVVFARNARKWKHGDGGKLHKEEEKSVSKEILQGWYDNLIKAPLQAVGLIGNGGGYSGGTWGGSGMGGKWPAPEYYYNDIYPADTLLVPNQRTFNDAFAEARRKGLETFDFDGKTYTTEMSDNPNWRKAGDARTVEEIVPLIIPADTVRHRSDTPKEDVIHPHRFTMMKSYGGPLYEDTLFALGGDIQMHGGDYSVGQVYNVSEEEANRLKAMGYEFEYVN